MRPRELTTDEIRNEINEVLQSPRDLGTLKYIVLRLPNEGRETPREAHVSPEGGLDGDRWGIVRSPNIKGQISVANARFLEIVAGSADRMPLSGDNLLVDLDLQKENLPTGARLTIGTAVFEVTDLPHTGCAKFESRYGLAALNFTRSKAYETYRLRGLFIQNLEPGTIRVGDVIRKMM